MLYAIPQAHCLGQIKKNKVCIAAIYGQWYGVFDHNYQYLEIPGITNVYMRYPGRYYIGDQYVTYKSVGHAVDAYAELVWMHSQPEYIRLKSYKAEIDLIHWQCKQQAERIYREVCAALLKGLNQTTNDRLAHINRVADRVRSAIYKCDTWVRERIVRMHCHDDRQARDEFWKGFRH